MSTTMAVGDCVVAGRDLDGLDIGAIHAIDLDNDVMTVGWDSCQTTTCAISPDDVEVYGSRREAERAYLDRVAKALADDLDKRGDWDWSDDAERDRVAVAERNGAFFAVYRGTEPDEAVRYSTRDEAQAKADEWIAQVEES